MKYVLVDKIDNIVDRVELGSEVGLSGAKTFFIGRKQIPYENFIDGFDPGRKRIDRKEFDRIWRVMTEESYEWLKAHTKKPSSKNIKWWKDETDYLDIEKS